MALSLQCHLSIHPSSRMKVKLSVYQSIDVLVLYYGRELWVVTERMRSRIQAAKMSSAT